jgi:hypothetical protein
MNIRKSAYKWFAWENKGLCYIEVALSTPERITVEAISGVLSPLQLRSFGEWAIVLADRLERENKAHKARKQ